MTADSELLKSIVDALVTLVAAFAGAFFAFRFEKRLRDKERVDSQVAAGNLALFILMCIWNKQRQYQKDIIDEWRGKRDAWLNLPASASIADSSLIFDLKDLSFVLEAKGAIFQFTILEADRFRNIARSIDERNELVFSEVFPRMSHAGMDIGHQIDEEILKKILTVGVVRRLVVVSDALIKHIDENVATSRDVFRRLRVALKEIHPKRKFIDFTDDPAAVEIVKKGLGL